MNSSMVLGIISFILLKGILARADDVNFDQNYNVTWGFDHAIPQNGGKEMQLVMDKSSGAGFESKLSYASGFFHMRIKLPDRNSAGVVTTFYLTSKTSNHDELDFEFLGNREGQPIILQTNVFANGQGNREQRIHLWFDPTADFHDYGVLWNQHQIVFFIDGMPIRVYKKNQNIGVSYPTQPMQIEASLRNGEDWATDGGATKTDWSYAPFTAYYQGFDVNGCAVSNGNIGDCYSTNYWWNTEKYWTLDANQQGAYDYVRKNFLIYDYCSDKPRFPTPPPECLVQL